MKNGSRCWIFLLIFTNTVFAQLTVAPGGWGDFDSIQAAVDAADPAAGRPVVICITKTPMSGPTVPL